VTIGYDNYFSTSDLVAMFHHSYQKAFTEFTSHVVEATLFARHNNAMFFETSAKTGENIHAVFDSISELKDFLWCFIELSAW